MFYEQFSKITNLLNPEFVERFDCWLATLPSNNQKNITASSVAARLGASYTQAEEILKYAERQKILEKEFLMLYSELGLQPKNIYELMENTGLKYEKLVEMLLQLQLKGLVEQPSYNYYSRLS